MIDYRSDVFPPFLALTLSLLLHSTLLGVHPLSGEDEQLTPIDTVVVQFLDEGSPAGRPGVEAAPPPPTAEAATPETAPTPQPSPAPQPEAAPTPATVAEPPPPAHVEPAPPPEAVGPAELPPKPAQPPTPAAPENPSSASPALEPGPSEVVPAPPTLSALLPKPDDLRRHTTSPELPDPTAAGVREATLSLGNADLRYRGYLETVHASIDRSEKWKEAVLMGGGGVVVVRMTITSLGQLENAEITRSSGSHLLDGAALEAVEKARIPPFPSHWTIEKLHLYAQFNYQLVTR